MDYEKSRKREDRLYKSKQKRGKRKSKDELFDEKWK